MVRKLVLLLAVAAAVLVPGRGARAALPCGLPDVQPLWVDYAQGSVGFRKNLFAHPGIVAATSGTLVPRELRAGGAQTVYWEMHLRLLVGTTSRPADPSTVAAAANRLVDRAAASTGCPTPLIALNELAGPATTTPWTPNNAQYRADVLTALQTIAARGATPFLLIPGGAPYTDGDAAAWWREASASANLVPEVYLGAPGLYRQGPILASRRLRVTMRAAVARFTALGIAPARLGIVLGFQSGSGAGGREGLQPTRAWLEVVKLETLAAKEVASELGLGTVWSWGWGTFGPATADPDKPAAACVYLWARDQGLCSGVNAAGPGFDASLVEGQIDLPPGTVCTVGQQPILQADVDALAAVTGDPEVALSALLERLVDARQAAADPAAVLAAEQAVVSVHFGGSRGAYLASLARAHAGPQIARDILAGELSRARIAASLTVQAPAAAAVRAFYRAYPEVLAREVTSTPAPPWLGGGKSGFVLRPVAPAPLFALAKGRSADVRTAGVAYSVRALGEPIALGALPFPLARPAIGAALAAFARDDALDAWTIQQENQALSEAICLGDHLPVVGPVDLTAYLPYLALTP